MVDVEYDLGLRCTTLLLFGNQRLCLFRVVVRGVDAFGVAGLGRLGLVLAIVELGVRGHKTVYLYFPEKVLVVRVAIEAS